MKSFAMAVVAVALGAVDADATVIATDFFDAPGYSLGGALYPDSSQDMP